MIQLILSICALVAAVSLPVFLFWSRRRSASAFTLSVAMAATAALELFDLFAVLHPEQLFFWKKAVLVTESFLPSVWLFFSITYARQSEFRSIPRLQRLLLLASLCFPPTAFFFPVRTFIYSPDFSMEQVIFLGDAGFFFYIGLLVFLIVSLINLEMTLANASLTSRWKIKFEIVGSGLLLAVLIFYYSQGLLYRTINMNLLPVRSMALIVASVLAGYSVLTRGNGVRISVSRNIAYKSLVLFAVGIYLVGLGLMGEGLRYFGESFQRNMAITLAFLAGTGLLIILLSETAKRKIKVYLHKNFYQNKYDYRTQWLQFTDRLSSSKSSDELLRSILVGFSETFGSGGAALFLADHEHVRYVPVADYEMGAAGVAFACDSPLVDYLAERGWVANLNEEAPDVGGSCEDFLRRSAASFVIPLFLDNSLDGLIVLGKQLNPSESYNYEDYDLMKTLARQASSAILNLRLADQLTQAREMEAVGRVSAFVIHDLKNLVYTVSLILDNARDYLADPEFQQDMLESLGNTVARMKVLISRLKNLPEKHDLQREPVDLLNLVRETTSLVAGSAVSVHGTTVVAEVDGEEVRKVALNLLLNAVDATGGKGPVVVDVGVDDGAFIRVSDSGCGISEEFRHNHLFVPFRTTKKKGLGIGLYQCKQIVEAHGGMIEVESEPGKGAVFTVRLPLVSQGL